MKMSLARMIDEILVHAGRSLSVRELLGALRVMFAVKPTRRELRRACFGAASIKRDGSAAYRVDRILRADRLWREIEAC